MDTDTGELSLKVKDSSNAIPAVFWSADGTEAIIYVRISDSYGNDVVSDIIPMVGH